MNKMQDKSSKLNNIRAIAISLVVLGHSIIIYSSNWDLYETDRVVPLFDYLKMIIDIIQMPLFFALSGFLFYYTMEKLKDKKRNILSVIIKKVKRLLIPYLIFSLCYLIPIRLILHYPNYQGKTFFDLIYNIIMVTDVGHLWYLPTLFLIFVIASVILIVLNKLIDNIKIISLIFFVLSVVLYFYGYLINFNIPVIANAFSNIIWFALGYMFCIFNEILEKIFSKIILKVLLIILCVVLMFINIFNITTNGYIIAFLKIISVLCIFYCVTKKQITVLDKISRNSMGIYLFHSPLIYITFTYIPNSSPLLILVLNFVVFGFVSYYLTELFRKLNLTIIFGE